MTATPVTARPVLVGNRLVLAGSVLYLLEWVAIFAASVDVPLGAEASTADVTSGYAGLRLELAAQLEKIVDLAVEDDDVTAVRRPHRLVAALAGINDGEAAVAEC